DRNDDLTLYGYDAAGNVLGKEYFGVTGYSGSDPNYSMTADVSESFTWDGLGRMLSAGRGDDPNDPCNIGYSVFSYYDLGPLAAEQQRLFDEDVVAIGYGYDQAGNLIERANAAAGESVTYARDGLGRIVAISRDNGLDSVYTVAEVAYLGRGVKRIDFSEANLARQVEYDNLGQIMTVTNTAADPDDNLEFIYAYDEEGNRTQAQYAHLGPVKYDKYGYDPLNRLTGVEYGASSGWSLLQRDGIMPGGNDWEQFEGMDLAIAAAEAWLGEELLTADDADSYGLKAFLTTKDTKDAKIIDMMNKIDNIMNSQNGNHVNPVNPVENINHGLSRIFTDCGLRPYALTEARRRGEDIIRPYPGSVSWRLREKEILDDQTPMIYATVASEDEDAVETTAVQTERYTDEAGYGHIVVKDAAGETLTWTILDKNAEDEKDVEAYIEYDQNERMTLFRMYPDSGGWVDGIMDYDAAGALIKDVVIEYDENGDVVREEDMLLYAAKQRILASLKAEPMTTSSLDGGEEDG
ncbi:MAG: hypothetical protein JW765_04300, partial [Deltaproteobacteria bacterium]|nr:hypothetical protein [Candidatus Zymogenaceae bacterium]